MDTGIPVVLFLEIVAFGMNCSLLKDRLRTFGSYQDFHLKTISRRSQAEATLFRFGNLVLVKDIVYKHRIDLADNSWEDTRSP